MPLYSKTGEVKYTTRRPIVYPAGKWDKDTTYIANSFSCPQVEHEGQYYVLNRLGECIGVNPKESSASNDGIWILMDKMQYLFTEVLMAEFAKLASAIYWGDYTFSQYGKDASGGSTTDYSKFDPMKIGQSDCPFTPNLMIDWLLGKLTANDVFLKGVIEAVSGKIAGFEIDGNNLSNSDGKDCWISINYKDGTKTRVAALGNNLPSELGFSTSGYHEESGTDENRAMVLRAKGSNFPRGYYLRNSNFAIDAYGGCLWDMDENDFLCIPGLLFVCEVTTTADKTVSIARQFGDGCGHVQSSYNIGLREYYFDLEHMHNNIYPLPVASYQRESGAYAGSTGSYNISGNRITVVFWEGAGKVYPQKFTLFILGRPAIK